MNMNIELEQNNIKRIKGIIKRLCAAYGEEIAPGIYGFPSAEKLSSLYVEDGSYLKLKNISLIT